MKLITETNIAAPDDFYQMLVDAHRDLAAEHSRLLNAKLILLLANHIGSIAVLKAAIVAAAAGVERTAPDADLRVRA